MVFLRSLTLQNFRNYNTARFDDLARGFVVLTGENGAGKTNVLEAVSLLAPGRGLRGAKMPEIQRVIQNMQDSTQAWSVAAQIETQYGMIPVGTGLNPNASKRHIRIKGMEVKAQTALSEYLSVIWLTPQMDGLFLGGASDRRRFFDRMVQVFDPSHAGRLTRYENALRERSKILTDDTVPPDPIWLSGVEQVMAETALAIAAARVDFITRLSAASDLYAQGNALRTFPLGVFALNGMVERALLEKTPALAIEDQFKEVLQRSRPKDAHRGGAQDGPHKTDILVTHRGKNMPAVQCSTGEQKALLTGIVLSFAKMVKDETATSPILLLDEIAAHFDAQKRDELFGLLHDFEAQSWITGTDPELFTDMPGQAHRFSIKNGKINQK